MRAIIIPLAMVISLASSTATDSFEEARVALMSAIQKADESSICDALELVAKHDQQQSANLFLQYGLPHESLLVHEEALRLVRSLESDGAREAIRIAARKSKSGSRRLDALRVIRAWPKSMSRPELLLRLHDREWIVVAEAVRALRDHPATESVNALIEKMPEVQGRLREDIWDVLKALTGQPLSVDPSAWSIWWREARDDWDPSSVSSPEEEQRKSLPTAVKDGLYGEIVSERVIFLLDVSGSMLASTEVGGTRIEIARKQLQRVLEGGLDPKSRFSVVAFSEQVARFSPTLVKAKASILKKAIKFVGQLRAGGETNTYGALEHAFADREVDTVYLLSDGSPTVGEETSASLILHSTQIWNRYRGTRIHCIGFFAGDAPNQDEARAREFLRDLAHRNHGRYTEIR
ncbi:MAG: VWA domain-containing protein [Planctomycetota bacterium]|nr:VWA domain-containing protein [Planctomycetota bacterium]